MSATLVGALLLVVLPSRDAGSQPPAQTFTVSGTIVDAKGERLRPTLAILRRDGDSGVAATTWSSTKDGQFTMLNLAPGDYRLSLEALPFATLKGRPIKHFAGVRVTVTADVTGLQVVASPGVTLQGRIVPPADADGPAPDLRNVWVVAAGAEGRASALAMVGSDLRFTLAEVFGAVRIDVPALPEGYVVKAVMLGLTDITGQLIEVTPDEAREIQVVLARSVGRAPRQEISVSPNSDSAGRRGRNWRGGKRPVCRKEQTRPTVQWDTG